MAVAGRADAPQPPGPTQPPPAAAVAAGPGPGPEPVSMPSIDSLPPAPPDARRPLQQSMAH